MSTYITRDEFTELTLLVRQLQGDVTTLSGSVGELDTLVERINHLTDLKDVTITYITEGDVLQYGSDGTWHNITPAELGISIGGSGGTVDAEIVKAMIKSEGQKLFLSKLYDDTATGMIAFTNGLTSSAMTYHKDGIQIGNFIAGIVGGTGAKIDKDGRAEMTSLTLREFLEVPELRFNKIDVVSGELWNSIAFGTIESVDTVNQIVTLKLEDGEYSGIHINDICRGIFNNMGGQIPDPGSTGSGQNDPISGVDECGFNTLYGFSTAYFTPIEILDQYGKKFRYSLKPGTVVHPLKAMKFAVYGNFVDKTRQNSAYSTRTFKRYLKDVNLWSIDYTNIASQFGLLDGLTIPGAPNEGKLTGNGAYVSNIYLTDAFIQFTPEQKDELKGQDAYQVSLDRETATIIVDNDNNIIEEYNQLNALTFNLQVWKGATELQHSDIMTENSYFVEFTPIGVQCTFDKGKFKVIKITNVNDMRIEMKVNCEGLALVKKVIWLNYQLEGNSVWVTYNDNDAVPEIPTGDGTSFGWHRNWTSTAIWMSTKSSRRLDEGEWGDPVRFVGASVQGEDGQYTVFCYTNAAAQPPTPTNSQIPPTDATTTWYMYPPTRENNNVFTWMTQATVYPDKTLSGWTEPIRITGETGEDGTDGLQLEYIYKLTSEYVAPEKPANSQQDDYVPYGWADNPQGVSKTYMYEWVCTRKKKPVRPDETAKWEEFTTPVLWAKWGEKGMDGDGYEYIFTRTADVDKVPLTPASIQQNDYIPTISNGGSKDYNWTDDPKGVNEQYKAEWTCTRSRKDTVWSNFSTPALWSNWGEQGLPGGNYQYRWKVSATKPTTTPATDSSWLAQYDDNQPVATGEYVWQIQRFKNADGTFTDWGNIIRLTGVDGKDGEDGNSIEFIYTRNADGKTPTTPISPNTSGHVPSGWTDHPSGVTSSLMYEWVTQRTMNKATQTWSVWSTPGVWARYSERGKDGDGFEYIYRRFSTYQSFLTVGPGGAYYPPTNASNYQEDDYVPSGWTDNPVGPVDTVIYEYVWTRKKKNGVWGVWSTGAMWAKWSEDGKPGDPGDPGEPGRPGDPGKPGYTYNIDPGAFSINEDGLGYYQPDSATFKCYKSWVDNSGNTNRSLAQVYWECWGSNSPNPGPGVGTEVGYTSGQSSFTINFTSKGKFKYYWIGIDPVSYPDSSGDPAIASLSFTVTSTPEAANTPYIYTRLRGSWQPNVSYYYKMANQVSSTEDLTGLPNYPNVFVRDVVTYNGFVYIMKSQNSSVSGSSFNTSYWTQANSQDVLSVNTLLASNGKLGDFSFSQNKFTSPGGKLVLDSTNGTLTCTDANITGKVTATSGTFTGIVYASGGKFSGEIEAKSGLIGSFKIQGNGLTNNTFESDSYIIIRKDSEQKYAAFGNINITGFECMCYLYNDKVENNYAGSHYTQVLSSAGANDNTALLIKAGKIKGLAYHVEIVTYGQTINRETAVVICNNTSTITLTLPTMDIFDDGHTVKVKRISGNGKDALVRIMPGGSYHAMPVTNTSGIITGYTRQYRNTRLLVDNKTYIEPGGSAEIRSVGDSCEFVYVRDLMSSNTNGLWVQFKNPWDWNG